MLGVEKSKEITFIIIQYLIFWKFVAQYYTNHTFSSKKVGFKKWEFVPISIRYPWERLYLGQINKI